jgi:aspartate aminotransferase
MNDSSVFSSRMPGIQPSPASILRRRARELRAAGRYIIELSWGNLDFATPDHVIAAAHSAALRGETRYTDVDGTPEMKQAVRAALLRDHHLSYGQDEIIICNGSTQAQFNALLATLEPGDEVIVPAPYWAPYLDQVRLLGGTPVVVPCPQNNRFRLRPEDLRAAITPRTRWLVINNPVTGAVYRREDLAEIAAVLRGHPDVWIMADGLYEHIVFDRDHAPTLAEIEPCLQRRTLTVSGVAKTYAMMGWRIGYAAGPAGLIREMTRSSRRPHPARHRSARPRRLQRSTGRRTCCGSGTQSCAASATALSRSSTAAQDCHAPRRKARFTCWCRAPG